MITMTKNQQDRMTPADALNALIEGNRRFMANLKINRNLLQQVNETREGQHPFAAIISCMDSRTSAELIFDQGLGDIFSIRIAGNIINDEILGSTEFGCKIIGAKIVLVLGHTGCGAIKGALEGVKLGNLNSIINRINRCIPNDAVFNQQSFAEKMNFVTESNVLKAINDIRTKSTIIARLEQEGQIKVVGAIYNVEIGNVKILSLDA
jgi:carbonic anhydrase